MSWQIRALAVLKQVRGKTKYEKSYAGVVLLLQIVDILLPNTLPRGLALEVGASSAAHYLAPSPRCHPSNPSNNHLACAQTEYDGGGQGNYHCNGGELKVRRARCVVLHVPWPEGWSQMTDVQIMIGMVECVVIPGILSTDPTPQILSTDPTPQLGGRGGGGMREEGRKEGREEGRGVEIGGQSGKETASENVQGDGGVGRNPSIVSALCAHKHGRGKSRPRSTVA